MVPSRSYCSAEVRASVGPQLQRYRQARWLAAEDQRQRLAAQVAERQDAVNDMLADLDARFAANAELQREQLRAAVLSIRTDVANFLQMAAADRRERTALAQQERTSILRALRRAVADYLCDLNRQRGNRTPFHAPQVHLEHQLHLEHLEHQAPQSDVATLQDDFRQYYQSSPLVDDRASRMGQSGMVAYVQMARVSISRTLEEGAVDEVQQNQIATHIEGLIGNVRPFLVETMANLAQMTPVERTQMVEVAIGVQRNVTALIHELETTSWPTIPSQRQTFLHMVENLRHRLAPLRDDLAVAVQSLQENEQPKPEPTRAAEPTEAVSIAHTYRDNLTTIHGIGPALQQRLDRAGIHTYIQLALSNPDELRKVLGEAGRLANVEDWIVQARSLAGITG